MKPSSLRPAALLGLSLALAACAAHDGSSPQLPTSPAQSGTPAALDGVAILAPPGVSSGVEMQASSVGPPPTGFKTIVRVKPRPGLDGVIRGESPLTVEFDLCDSTADAGKTLFYYYDWDFNHIADAGGTGTTCLQEHTYRARPVVDARGDETVRTNICVANGDFGAHNPSTFVACREFTVVIPIPAAPGTTTVASFSGSFTQGQDAEPLCPSWNAFRASIDSGTTYSEIILRGSADPTGKTCTGASANTLCQNLRTGTSTALSCDGNPWNIGGCGNGIEISTTGTICQCPVGHTVRPCIQPFNPNWGGMNTATCSGPSQTLEVICQ